MKPLFVWAGGKRKLLKHYQTLLPKNFHTFVEPFFGGGAVYAHLDTENAIINDVNWELMDLYRWIAHDPKGFIVKLNELSVQYISLDKIDRKRFYYEHREQYWRVDRGELSTSVLLFFLLKTCFNGIWQACKESKGRFGTPCGLLNHNGTLVNKDEILTWSNRLKDTQIFSTDYAVLQVPSGSFVFCDPPYRSSFADYNTVFGDDQQVQLIEWARKIALNTKSEVWIANREIHDGFWEQHAPDAAVHHFPITYTAGRRLQDHSAKEITFSAKKAIEILLVFRP